MNERNFRVLPLLALIFASAAGCKEQSTEAGGPGPERPGGVIAPAADGTAPLNIDQQVAAAKRLLAQQLGIEPDNVDVASVRTVHWRSGAAGCPKPGMAYTMAIVPGVLIVLRADGAAYRFHAGRNRAAFYCPAERAEAPVYGQGEEAM